MKIIAIIEEPAVVARILKHLGLWRTEARRGDRRGTTPLDAVEAPPGLCCAPFDHGWPAHEEPTYTPSIKRPEDMAPRP